MRPVHERASKTEAKPSPIERQDPYFLAVPVLEQIEQEDEKARKKAVKSEKTARAKTELVLASPFKFEPSTASPETGDELFQQGWALFAPCAIFSAISLLSPEYSFISYLVGTFFYGAAGGRFKRGMKKDRKNVAAYWSLIGLYVGVTMVTSLFLPVLTIPAWYLIPGLISAFSGMALGDNLTLPSKNR